MDTLTIVNEIDNAENDAELHAALELVADDIAHQFLAAWNAQRDNPYVDAPSMVQFMGVVEAKALALLTAQGS